MRSLKPSTLAIAMGLIGTTWASSSRTSEYHVSAFDSTTGLNHPFNIEVVRSNSVEVRVDGYLITVPMGQSTTIKTQSEVPVRDVYITVSATRIKRPTNDGGAGTTRDRADIAKFGGSPGGDIKQVTKTAAGVAEDSAGQQHVRGEHTEISYVIDGIPLPDTLSGRQGSIVIPSTIESVDIILGGFAAEFGGQTAAVLDVRTLPRAAKAERDLVVDGGTYAARNGVATITGPIGKRGGYVVNLASNQTKVGEEPQQPDRQDTHSAGSDFNAFTKFTFQPSSKDRIGITLSTNPSRLQIGNRTGLPDSFASGGQGYGFLGLRNQDGKRPDASDPALGSDDLLLSSQQDSGMDINQKEANEFATLAWRRQVNSQTVLQMGFALLHSGQDVSNNNPNVDVLNLPVDNSIEYNPTASRNIHHVQVNGNLSQKRGRHSLKAGFLIDQQSGKESYQIVPASQLALDALAATAPSLAPEGHESGETDVNGNPVYIADSATSPTLNVDRTGSYRAAYLQDTWKPNDKWVLNYGWRLDSFQQKQNLGQPTIDKSLISPRFNANYFLSKSTIARASFNKLFNTPPLAQGAIIGEPLKPPVVDQYDVSLEHSFKHDQNVKVAYYYKDIRNQIDVGLLIPGSQIGLYSGVNLERGGVHGLEFSYNISAPKGVGWDAYFNYTLSAAKPNGVDNTGADVPDFNDHDQRQTVGLGLAYTTKRGESAAMTVNYGSGLASSIVPPSTSRTPRTEVDLRLATRPRMLGGVGGIGLDILNVFDSRQVINFQSAFSGTRFQIGRRYVLSASFKF